MQSLKTLKLLPFLLILASLIYPYTTSVEAQISSQIVVPDSFSTQSGSIGGQSVNAMRVKDQSGKADSPNDYVLFTTPGVVYKGTQVFRVPGYSSDATVSAMEFRVNYKGPSHSRQKWSWSILNTKNNSWSNLGSNTNTGETSWTLFKFKITDLNDLIDSTSDIRIMLTSNNSDGDAKIDYEAISITFKNPEPPSEVAATTTLEASPISTISDYSSPTNEPPEPNTATPTLLPVSTPNPIDTTTVLPTATLDPVTDTLVSLSSPTLTSPSETTVPSLMPSNIPSPINSATAQTMNTATQLPTNISTALAINTATPLPTNTATRPPTNTTTLQPSNTASLTFTVSPTQNSNTTNYYVATNGKDSNSGSLTLPFANISKALSVAKSGDVINVRSGIYPGFYIDKSNITLSGYNGEMPVISGGIGIRCYQQTNVVVQGFDVTNTIAGNYVGAIMLDQCNGSIIQNNKIHDNTNAYVSGITINGGSNNKILNNDSYNNSSGGIDIAGVSLNNEVAFNNAHDNTLAAGNADGISIADPSVTNTNIHDNIVFGNSDDGIDTWTSAGNTITHNTSYENGGTGDGNGFKLGGAGIGGNNTVTGNISHSNLTSGFTSNGSGDYYANNTAYNNGAGGFDDSWRENGNTQTSTFIDNLAYNNPGGNFLKDAKYTTVFIGNSEVPQ